MSEVTLKPCPAEYLHTVDRGGPTVFRRRSDIFGVYCQTCQCSTEYYSSEPEAIDAWNTRAEASSAEPVADLAGYERGQRETVERIVAWLGDWIDQTMGADIGPAYLIKRIEAGEWK